MSIDGIDVFLMSLIGVFLYLLITDSDHWLFWAIPLLLLFFMAYPLIRGLFL